jgi:group I intron endonuclease
MGIIYCYENIVNNKKYIGQTTQPLRDRICQHNTERVCRKLYYAIQKYGINKFSIYILEQCLDSELNEKEIYWINYHNSIKTGYNIRFGGSRGKNSEETKHKISLAVSGEKNGFYGRKHSEETKEKIRQKKIGSHVHSEEWKNHLKIWASNQHHSLETKSKLSTFMIETRKNKKWTSYGMRGKHHSEVTKAKMRGPRQQTRKFVISFEVLYDLYIVKRMSAREIGKQFNVGKSPVLNALQEYNISKRKGNIKYQMATCHPDQKHYSKGMCSKSAK